MRNEMKHANLSVPLIESNRSSNTFVLTLLSHHLFDQNDIDWLKGLKEYHLSDEDAIHIMNEELVFPFIGNPCLSNLLHRSYS